MQSVQARLVACHYSLSSSRPNQAWFLFGTVVQLTLALGLHQRQNVGVGSQHASPVIVECRKRVFWVVFCSDKFISIALGRPNLLCDEYVTQDFPGVIHDKDIGGQNYDSDTAEEDTDFVMAAPVYQARLALIIGKALREEQNMSGEGDSSKLDMAIKFNTALENWHAALPPMFSGAIKPTSLVPVFRRQADALNSFYLFAVLHVNIPLLLTLFSHSQEPEGQDERLQYYTQNCVEAARSIARVVGGFAQEKQKIEVYWFTQYNPFKALSIIYLHLIQAKGFRERCHADLADATNSNSPSLRYAVILEELQSEVRRILDQRVDIQNPRLEERVAGPGFPSEAVSYLDSGGIEYQAGVNAQYAESAAMSVPDWNLNIWSEINSLSLHLFDNFQTDMNIQ
ncbi:hypothetical protein N7528_006707 [Penicillium herquei]|nr:hypothetical protein N7528_006707 [Penicillium herquei]